MSLSELQQLSGENNIFMFSNKQMVNDIAYVFVFFILFLDEYAVLSKKQSQL